MQRDCLLDFQEDIQAADLELEKDTRRCNRAMFPETCMIEADAVHTNSVDTAVTNYERCTR